MAVKVRGGEIFHDTSQAVCDVSVCQYPPRKLPELDPQTAHFGRMSVLPRRR